MASKAGKRTLCCGQTEKRSRPSAPAPSFLRNALTRLSTPRSPHMESGLQRQASQRLLVITLPAEEARGADVESSGRTIDWAPYDAERSALRHRESGHSQSKKNCRTAKVGHGAGRCDLQKLNRRKWFGNVVICAGLQAFDRVGYGGARCEHDDRNAARLPISRRTLNPSRSGSIIIEVSQAPIPPSLARSRPSCAVSAPELRSLRYEIIRQHFGHILVVIDQQDPPRLPFGRKSILNLYRLSVWCVSRHLTKDGFSLRRPSIALSLSSAARAERSTIGVSAVQEAPCSVVPLILPPSTVPVNDS